MGVSPGIVEGRRGVVVQTCHILPKPQTPRVHVKCCRWLKTLGRADVGFFARDTAGGLANEADDVEGVTPLAFWT